MAKDKTARDVALEVLLRVEQTRSYANLVLAPALAKSSLSSRDRALTTELVYGTVRTLGTLDWALQERSNMPLAKLDPPVRALMRLGAYQLLFTRIPPAAACFEAVQQAKRVSHEGSARFVNAVLRRLARERSRLEFPDIDEEPVRHIALKYSHPEWLVQRWLERLGLEDTLELCRADNLVPPLCLRANLTRTTRSELIVLLKRHGLVVSPHHKVPEALYVEGSGMVEGLPGFQAGLFTVQDESSMLATHALAPKAGERLLDACAGPGGKTTHLAEFMNDRGQILALDIHPHKLTLVRENAARLHLDCINTREADARRLPPDLRGAFTKVLVDAPCSGTGVLRRRPDLRWRKTPEELTSLPKMQLKILVGASEALAVDGTLLYSTCSLEPEENMEVVTAFLALRPEFVLTDLRPTLGEFIQEPTLRQGFLQLYPHKHELDGFFLAGLKRCQEGKNHD